jgi:hypothetical protein
VQYGSGLVAADRTDRNRSDAEADSDPVEVSVLTHYLADGATESGAERTALQDSPDRVAGRVIEILGDVKDQLKLVEE